MLSGGRLEDVRSGELEGNAWLQRYMHGQEGERERRERAEQSNRNWMT